MSTNSTRCSTGIYGLDDVLLGGFPAHHVYLIEGDPGAGKTTLGLQFLVAGVANGEKGLYVTMAESREELQGVARSHGLSLEGIEVFEVHPPELATSPEQEYTVFHPAEVELADVVQAILRKIDSFCPGRVVIDSMSEIRMMAREMVRYRRQMMALKQFFTGKHCTALLLDDRVPEHREVQLETISHGVLRLESLPREYGIKRRRLEILKVRASGFREGYHDYIIETGGLRVFPRLVSAEHHGPNSERTVLPSGFKELDELFGGGVTRGTTTLVIGPAGCGKSSITANSVATAAERGEAGAIFTFDEGVASYLERCASLGIPLERHKRSGRVHFQQIDPAELAPGDFVHRIRAGVEEKHWTIIVIDSLNGLLNAMAGEQALTVQLHELLAYLNQMGVATFLVMAQYGILGSAVSSPIDVSYLADNVLLLRYFEAQGKVRQAISVVKKRTGAHERAIRELMITNGELRIGEPLDKFHGVLTGTPEYEGGATPLL